MRSVLRWCVTTYLLAGPATALTAPSVRAVDPRASGLAVASDGADYLVVGSPCAAPGPGLCGTRVRGAGAVIEPAGFPISGATAEGVAVAFDGTSYAVVWAGAGGVEYARVSTGGVVLDAPAVQLWPAGHTPSVASNGSGVLVVWEVFRERRLYGPPGPAWADITGVYQAPVNPDGVSQPPQLVSWAYIDEHHASQYFFPLVASDGAGYQVAMQVLGYAICDLTGVGRRVAYNLCLTPIAELASDGAGYFMVWDNYDFGDHATAGVLGASLAAPGAVSVINATSRVVQKPALTFDGQGYLAVWQDGALYATRLLTDGTVIDAAAVLLSGTGPFASVHVASNGTTSLVTWSGGAAMFTPAQPRHLRLAPAWSPLGGGTRVRLTGQGLEAGASVTVGGLLAPEATLVGPGVMVFTTPAHEAGAVDVVVTNPDGRSGRLAAALTYAGAPYLATVIPPRGPAAGHARVTLVGAGFEPGMKVRFGEHRARAVVVVDEDHATCTTPPGAGTVPVTVIGPAGQSSTLEGAYLYEHRRPGHRPHTFGDGGERPERDGEPRAGQGRRLVPASVDRLGPGIP